MQSVADGYRKERNRGMTRQTKAELYRRAMEASRHVGKMEYAKSTIPSGAMAPESFIQALADACTAEREAWDAINNVDDTMPLHCPSCGSACDDEPPDPLNVLLQAEYESEYGW